MASTCFTACGSDPDPSTQGTGTPAAGAAANAAAAPTAGAANAPAAAGNSAAAPTGGAGNTAAAPTAGAGNPAAVPTAGAGGAGTMNAGVTFSQLHTLLVANCTGDGTCHGNGTDTGMYPHPEFANTDEAVSKSYVDAKIDTILTRINSTVLDPMAFGTRRMPPSDYDPEGLTVEEKALVQAYADTLPAGNAGAGGMGPTAGAGGMGGTATAGTGGMDGAATAGAGGMEGADAMGAGGMGGAATAGAGGMGGAEAGGSAGMGGAGMAVTFTQVHMLLVANCTGDGTCHGNGTDTGMYPHPEFANTDEAVSKGYVDEKIDTILTRITSTELDPMAFGTRRMPPSDVDPDGLSADEIALIQAYADSL